MTNDDLLRYARHIALPGFGITAQKKLKASYVVVIGAGGLGAPVLSYLTAAGVGRIKIIDFDIVSISNLQRQVLFNENDIGQSKATVAGAKLQNLNTSVSIDVVSGKLTSDTALEWLQGCDLIIDCSDNFPTRYLLNDAAVLLNIPVVYGSIFRYEGQVAVFNFHGGACYRDLYPLPPAPGVVQDCEQAGVLGVLPGIIGSMQANEAMKILTGIGTPLSGKLLLFDSLNLETRMITIPDQNSRSKIKTLIDYDDFCSPHPTNEKDYIMKEVTVQQLKEMIDSSVDFQLIDVREPHEYEVCNLGGELIPMSEIPASMEKIDKDKQVVVHCRSGKRSGDIVNWLEKNGGYQNLYNLKGGILAWAKEIDTSMPTY